MSSSRDRHAAGSPKSTVFPSAHMRRDSGDFGAFSAAAVPPHTSDLLEGDLLGSFEDLGESSELKSHPSIEPSKRDPSFGIEDAGKRKNLAPLPSLGQPPATPMLRMTLPPRPSEISPDYIPPRRPLRRPSQPFDLLGPGSPPLVSIAGNDIVFHPASEVDDAPHPGLARSPTQSKLLHALTSTAKVAHKWKGVLEHVTPPQEVLMPTTAGHHEDHISQPIEVNHTTPFATPEQLAGVYVAPAGAPGFSNAGNHITRPNEQAMPESSRLRLVGRRLGTTEILTGHLASKLWSDLPSRHKLSRTWSLLFSLDQHGASLATMYRLIAKWAVNHRGVGNILIARDGNGQDFGVFLNEAIVKKEGSYFGGGESFLFKVSRTDQSPRVFRWTGRNQYFALCEANFVSFGGGGGVYGLILDSTFTHNSSATCPAFDNEILCEDSNVRSTKASSFECVGLEVWGLQ